MKNIEKHACLFFDQVNIYAKFGRIERSRRNPSTDLSTDIVDKGVARFRAVLGKEIRLLKEAV